MFMLQTGQLPSKHETLAHRVVLMLGQSHRRWPSIKNNIGSVNRVCWVGLTVELKHSKNISECNENNCFHPQRLIHLIK